MTREEAIENITEIKKCEAGVYAEALELAIKTLEQEPCEDAISRQAAIEALDKLCDRCEYSKKRRFVMCGACHLGSAFDVIEELPSVSVAEKTGRWIAQDIHNCHTNFKCSECGYIHNFMHLYGKPTADYTFCPNCGAKMEVEE